MNQAGLLALGLANSVDYVVEVTSRLLQDAVTRLDLHATEIVDLPHINTERDLLVTCIYFMVNQKGGERYIDNPDVLNVFAAHWPYHVVLGGTALRVANILAQEHMPSLLHCAFDFEEKSTLDPLITVIVNPDAPRGSFHPILQFQKGVTVTIDGQSFTAHASNRMILNHNPALKMLSLAPEFFEQLPSCSALLLSGLNAIHDPKILQARIAEIVSHLIKVSPELPVVYEDGHFHIPELRTQVCDKLAPIVDIFSMNEEEWQALLGKRIHLHSPADVLAALTLTHQAVPSPYLIIHTRNWALLSGPNPSAYKQALQSAVDSATAVLLGEDPIPVLPKDLEATTFANAITDPRIVVIPSYEISHTAVTSVGLGDAFIAGFIAKMPKRRF